MYDSQIGVHMIKKIYNKMVGLAVPFLSIIYNKRTDITITKARDNLEEYFPDSKGEVLANNKYTKSSCNLQIIIPAYNVEDYLEECIESVIHQETKYSYKIVLIDDGSTDNTPRIADELVEKYANTGKLSVIHQENRGFSGARNRGLTELFGEYVMFVDSDDILCPGAIDSLLGFGYDNCCDIVEGSVWGVNNGIKKVYYSHSSKMISGAKEDILHGQPWAKVYKARLFENIKFPEGYWFEDSILSFLVYPLAKNKGVVRDFVYSYRINEKGISSSSGGNPKSVDTYWITQKLMGIRENMGVVTNRLYFNKIMAQLIINQKRLVMLPEYIQESIFVLSADLVEKYFPKNMIVKNKNKPILKILLRKDWGTYKKYCKYIKYNHGKIII